MSALMETINYICKKGLTLEVIKDPDHTYYKSYDDLIVYHPEKCPEGLFENCLSCEIAELGLTFGLSESGEIEEPKPNFIKFCKIWQSEK